MIGVSAAEKARCGVAKLTHGTAVAGVLRFAGRSSCPRACRTVLNRQFSGHIGLVLLSLLVMLAGCSRTETTALPDLKGHYRVIAAFAENAHQAARLTNAFKSSPGLASRDIIWFVVGPDRITSSHNPVPSRKNLEKLHTVNAFQAVILGKNGTLMASQVGGLNIQGLVDSIDQPPPEFQQQP